MTRSPMDRVHFREREYFIKRDDLLTPLEGNKGRKLYHLLLKEWGGVERLVSYGGVQSNAMLALARLAEFKQRPFVYYTRPLPAWLRRTPVGNFAAALAAGMQYQEIERLDPKAMPLAKAADTLFVPQGAAIPEAQAGIRQLALELNDFAAQHKLSRLTVFVPSGTGTTSLYLQQYLDWPVYTTPCVGDGGYLRRQFTHLQSDPMHHPQILELPKKYPFAQPAPEFLRIWNALRAETGIEFDLLYDPKGWLALQYWQRSVPEPIVYVHCGGVSGNPTMLMRYRRLLAGIL